jgi:hypothetical protein
LERKNVLFDYTQTKKVIRGHSNATRHSRGELMGVDKVSHEHFLLLNSYINALKAKKSFV